MAIFSNSGQTFKSDGKAVLIAFIGAIIAATFLLSISDDVFTATNPTGVDNLTVTLSSSANGTTDIEGRDFLLLREIYNATSAGAGLATLPEGVAMQQGTGTDGLQSVQLLVNDTGEVAGHLSTTINVSYDYNPEGYVGTNGSTSVVRLIVLFAALAILIFVITVFIKMGSLGELMRRK